MKSKYGFDFVFKAIGGGLLVVGLLESVGLINYRPHRQPLGAATWFVAGAICLLIGLIVGKVRGG